HFRRLFTTLFDGGQAHLELVESEDPLEAGLEIMAQPPGKRLSSLTLLSGGEQALTAIALIFALFLTNPAPIRVLDEVAAPPDAGGHLARLFRRAGADGGLRLVGARVQRGVFQADRSRAHSARCAQAGVGRARAARQCGQLREAAAGEAVSRADHRARTAE